MLVFHAPSKLDYLLLRLLSFFLGLSFHVLDKARVVNRDTFKRPKNIHIVELSTEDKIGLLNTFDYPPENVINAYLDYLQIQKLYTRVSERFVRIENLDQKLNLSLVSSLNYNTTGLIYAYYLSQRQSHADRLYVINCDLKSFLTQEFKLFDHTCIHIALPLGQLVSMISQSVRSLFKTVHSGNHVKNEKTRSPILRDYDNQIAVMFHKSDSYGNLYRKHHYFSKDSDSYLHWDKVLKCVLFADHDTPQYLIPISATIDKRQLFSF